MSKPFIPRDKPKSWVVFVCAGLVALLGFGPVLFLAKFLDSSALFSVGEAGLTVCAGLMFLSWPVFMIGLLMGKYKNLPEKEWKDQVW